MSKNRRNFHYHYAEQYETKAERRERRRGSARRRARYAVTPAALVTAVIMLVVFGLMSTTFSSYADKPDSVVSEAAKSSGVLSQLRDTSESLSSTKIEDLSPVGANNDLADAGAAADIASTGTFTMPAGSRIYFDINSYNTWITKDNGSLSNSGTFMRFFYSASDYTDVSMTACDSTFSYRYYADIPNDGNSYIAVQVYSYHNNYSYSLHTQKHDFTNIYTNTVYQGSGNDWENSSLSTANYGINDGYGKIYFDNTVTQWSGKIYFLIGKDDYVGCYEMAADSDAPDIYYYELNPYNGGSYGGWDGYRFFGFAYKSSSTMSDSYGTPSAAYSAATGYTSIMSNWKVDNLDSTYIGKGTSSGSVTGLDFGYNSSGYNSFDSTQTLTVGAHGSATISGYEFTAHGAATATSQTVTGSGSNTISAAKSSTVTVDIHHDTGYGISAVTFDGNDITSSVSSGEYTYTADGSAHTIQVTFVELAYCAFGVSENSLTLDVGQIGSVNVTAIHHTTGNVVVSVSQADSAYVQLSNASGGTYGASATLSGFSSGPTAVYAKGIQTTTTPITVTVACGAGDTGSTSATFTVEVNQCEMTVSAASLSLDVGEVKSSITVSTAHHQTGNVTVSVSAADSEYVTLSNGNGVYGASATLSSVSTGPTAIYVKGIKPTASAVTVTVSCGVPHTGFQSDTFTVTVNNTDISPNSSSGSWTLRPFYDDTCSAAVTPSPSSGATVTYDTTLYADNAGNSVSTIDATINASTGSVYISNSSSNVGTGYVKITVTYDTGYTVDYYRPITVVARPTCALRGLKQDHDNSGSYWDEVGNMTYQSGGTYTIDVFLQGGETYGGGDGDYKNSDNYGFKIFYNNGYKANSGYWVRSTNCSNIDVSSGGSGSNMAIVTGTYGGFYTFTYNPSTDRLSVTYPTAEKYYLVGFNDVWPSGFIDGTHDPEDYEITVDGSGNAAVTETFTATESDSFKIYGTNGNKYWGCDATVGRTTDLGSGYAFYDDTVNCHFNAWYSGEYTFTFTGLTASAHSCTLTSVTGPARNVTPYAYLISSTTPVTQAGRTYVSMTDNYNDTFAVTTLTPSDDDSYEVSSWNSVGSSGTTSTTASTYGTIYQTVVTVTDDTQTDIISYWNYKSYSLKLYTRGATLPTTNLTGATYVQTTGSGDNLCYEYSYRYGTAVTLPTSFNSINATWTFRGWYDTSDPATMAADTSHANKVTSLSNTESGSKSFYAKMEMTIVFTDNVNSSNVIRTDTIVWGQSVTPPSDAAVSAATSGSFGCTRDLGDDSLGKWNRSGFSSFNNIKSGGTAYAMFKPVVESTAAIGVFTPGTNVTTRTDPTDGKTIYTIGFGSVLSALFSQPTAYNSAPENAIHYEYSIAVNGTPVLPYTDMSYQYNTADGRYEWYASSSNIATMLTLPNAVDTDYGYAVITFQAYFNDATPGNTKRVSSSTKTMTIYYEVDTPFTGLSVSPQQRIYSEAGSVPAVVANFTSHHTSASDTTDFTDPTKYKVEVSGTGITTPGSIGLTHGSGESYTATLTALFTNFLTKGVKDYVIQFWENNGTTWFTDGSATTDIHTTVGTSDSAGSRPLYFVADNDCDGYSVMMFYFDAGGNMVIQTGESFNRSGESADIYRFNVPSADTDVLFALIDTSASYELPGVSGTSLDFSSVSGTDHYYHAYMTSFLSVTGSVQSISASGVSGTALSCAATPMLDVDGD